MKLKGTRLVCALLLFGCGAAALHAGPGLKNLPPAGVDRITVADKTWPAEIGQADICLWKDDRQAAASITVDDNNVPNHEWWREIADKYDFRITWFVITSRITDRGGFFGTWADFIKLKEAGHDIQSHTVTHRAKDLNRPLDEDYGEAIAIIEKNMPGNKVVTLAYPGGGLPNDPDVAMKYYIGARGTVGHANSTARINYANTNSLSSFNYEASHWAGLPNLITRNPKRAGIYRGWYCMHFHGVNDELKAKIVEGLEYFRKNDFWIGRFAAVVKYGQERDTAELKTSAAAADRISLTLTDKMDDDLFDEPLTVKVRVADGWGTVAAKQGGKDIPATVVEHDGKKYALVQAVPDRGDVEVTRGK